jgi:MOSC domain-containing protein YiiM
MIGNGPIERMLFALVIASGLGLQSLLSANHECLASSSAIRFGRPEIVKRFLRSGRTGFYLAVLQERRITAGDSMESLMRDEHGVTAAGIVKLYKADATNQELLRRASELPALPPFWQDYFRKRLWDPDS